MANTGLSKIEIESRIKGFIERSVLMTEPYKGSTRAIHTFKCLNIDCGNQWSSSFNNVYKGSGCNNCSAKKAGYTKRLSNADLTYKISKLLDRNIKFIGNYTNSRATHEFNCITCDTTFHNTWSNVVSTKQGCPNCSLIERSDKLKVSRCILEDRLVILENSRQIRLLSVYTKFGDNHMFLCLASKCRYEWKASLANTWTGHGCPKCAGRKPNQNEKLAASYRRLIRSRLTNFRCRNLDKYPNLNQDLFISDLMSFWSFQIPNLPLKPDIQGVKFALDHIIPLSKFNTTLDEMKLCWDARNFQWLTAKDNAVKHNKIQTKYFTDWHFAVCDKVGIKYD